MELVRLNKYLKDQDICSRRKADEFIAKGYIKVNGQIITELGFKLNPLLDKVELSPELTLEKQQFRYIVLNKPKGYVCSKNREDGKPIFDLLPVVKNLTYAGRLDKDSHGLVILSNDGKFVYKVFGAEFAKQKEYIVRVNKAVTAEYLAKQANGSIELDGKLLRPAQVKQIGTHAYKITLTEGVNRQLRRMAEVCDYRVVDLKRIRIDNIVDRGLETGEWRELTAGEIKQVMAK
ncbi:MAG: rRNA pseudouridine synthase [Burkholderiales bacterium]|nr:rRNA pseudouridine synthase [Burkholderiales bacterium]